MPSVPDAGGSEAMSGEPAVNAQIMQSGPLARYRTELENGTLEPDAGQEQVVVRLEAMAAGLVRRRGWKRPSRSLFARWRSPEEPNVEGVKGLYLWGGVGRGKTHLCDLFFDSLPFEDKTRLHYHRFMQRIHADLRAARIGRRERLGSPRERVPVDIAHHDIAAKRQKLAREFETDTGRGPRDESCAAGKGVL